MTNRHAANAGAHAANPGAAGRCVLGVRVVRLGRVGSTMDEAAALAVAGEPEGTVVVADEQTAGRGRAGRAWGAPPGSALLLTVLLRPNVPPDRLPTLPLLAGVAVAEAIEAMTGVPVWLKWPNDVWLGDRNAGAKVAGILTTARTRGATVDYALLGIGVNVTTVADTLPPGATSLLVATGAAHDREALLTDLLDRLDGHYAGFVAADIASSLATWRQRAALLDEAVAVDVAGERRDGRFVGIDDVGALLLRRTDGAVERIVAGELTRGPWRRPD